MCRISILENTWSQITTNLGNGNSNNGYETLIAVANRLEYAREKHKWGKGQEIDSSKKALAALNSEIGEWIIANKDYERFAGKDYEQAVADEALDIIAIAIRIAAREWEN